MIEQPKPIPQYGKPATWALVQGDLLGRGEYAILSDISNRNQMGIQKYGCYLAPGNGRDSIRDAYEEAMDLTVYLMNAIQELPPLVPPGQDFRTLTRLYHQAVGIMCALKDYQDQHEADAFQEARDAFKEAKYSDHQVKPTEAPVESIPTAWGDVPSQTHEAHTGHPEAFQGVSVEVANLSPTVFIPDQIQGEARDSLLEWKAKMEVSLEAERTKYQKLQGDRSRAGGTSPIDLM